MPNEEFNAMHVTNQRQENQVMLNYRSEEISRGARGANQKLRTWMVAKRYKELSCSATPHVNATQHEETEVNGLVLGYLRSTQCELEPRPS